MYENYDAAPRLRHASLLNACDRNYTVHACIALSEAFELAELARLHDPMRGLEDKETRRSLQPTWLKEPVAADDQSGPVPRDGLEQKAPCRIAV